MLPSTRQNGVGIATLADFGAESSRPASLLCTLRTQQLPGEWQHSLPACSLALAGRDSHPLDFIKWFPLLHYWFLHFHAYPSAICRCLTSRGPGRWPGQSGKERQSHNLLFLLNVAGSSLEASPCFRLHTPLIELDGRISRIQLSEKVSRGRPRETTCPHGKADEAQHLIEEGFRKPPSSHPDHFVFGT